MSTRCVVLISRTLVKIILEIMQRQTLNILGVIHRYLTLKKMTPEERKKVNPRVVFFAGKAAPGCKSILFVLGVIH